MGTNFYLIQDICPHCKRGENRLHIGKSSGGWCFALHVDDEVTSLAEWQDRWQQHDARIVNEYGDTITPEDMLATITQRSWNGSPDNLTRHSLDGRHCIGHGDSTYDLIMGEFS